MEAAFAALGSSNSAAVRVKSVGDWWEADPESKLFKMAERALTREWGCQPLFVREGGTMPVGFDSPLQLCLKTLEECRVRSCNAAAGSRLHG